MVDRAQGQRGHQLSAVIQRTAIQLVEYYNAMGRVFIDIA